MVDKLYVVEDIVDAQVFYLVAWKGYPGENSWEPESSLVSDPATKKLLAVFNMARTQPVISSDSHKKQQVGPFQIISLDVIDSVISLRPPILPK